MTFLMTSLRGRRRRKLQLWQCIAMWPGPGSVPFEPRVLCFNKGPFVIGRFDTLQAASDTAYFKVPNVSRSHATLSFATGSFWVAKIFGLTNPSSSWSCDACCVHLVLALAQQFFKFFRGQLQCLWWMTNVCVTPEIHTSPLIYDKTWGLHVSVHTRRSAWLAWTMTTVLEHCCPASGEICSPAPSIYTCSCWQSVAERPGSKTIIRCVGWLFIADCAKQTWSFAGLYQPTSSQTFKYCI